MSINSKTTLVIVGIILGSVVSASGFMIFNYLNSAHAEILSIENFTVENVTDPYSAIEFSLRNIGNTNIEISSVKMNGYSNQSIPDWSKGWEGNLRLRPDQTGKVYVYEFAYFHVLNASMPQISTPPSQTELDSLNSWANSYSCTFAFITKTQNQYNQTVPRLASTMIQAWLESLPNTTQQESLYMSNLHVWYSTISPGWAEAAFVLINTGGIDVVLQKITARSQTSAWSNVYWWTTNTATVTSLSPTATQPSGFSISATINGTVQALNQASDIITLESGRTLVVYINHPDSVGQSDVGTPVAVTIFTANAQWTQEANVEAYSYQEQFNVAAVNFYGTSGSASNYINMTIQNTGAASFTIDTTAKVNDVNKTLAAQVTIAVGSSAAVKIPNVGWNNGQIYSLDLLTTQGTNITYVACAPSA